jgi:hypothetical protein
MPGSDVRCVLVQVVGPDLVGHCGPQVADRAEDPIELLRTQSAEDRTHPILLEGFDLVTDPDPARGRPDDDDPPVVRDANALDEATLLHPVDQAGGIAE